MGKYSLISLSSYNYSYDDDFEDTVLRDHDVEDVKRDSIDQHIMFAITRIGTLYIYPFMGSIQINILHPLFEMICKWWSLIQRCSYLIDFIWWFDQKVYDTGYLIYLNTLHPILTAIQDTISNTFIQMYTNFIQPIMHDYMYPPINIFCQIICRNFQSIFPKIVDAFWNLLQLLYGNICSAFSKIKWILSAILGSITNLYRFIYDSIAIFFVGIVDTFAYAAEITIDFLNDVYFKIVDGIKWSGNMLYQYILKPLGRLVVKLWSSYLQPIISKTIHSMDRFFSSFKNLLNRICGKIIDGIKTVANYIYDSILTICADYLCVAFRAVYDSISRLGENANKIICNVCNFMFESIKSFLVNIVDTFIQSMSYILDKTLKPFGNVLWDYSQIMVEKSGNVIFGHILGPLGKEMQKIWDEFMKNLKKLLQKIRDIFYLVIIEPFNCFLSLVISLYDLMHRYLFEMNVTKLTLSNDNEFLNNYEIGVYYATLGEQWNAEALYLNDQANPNDNYVYLWLRNNDLLKRANVKIQIYDNKKRLFKTMVRLNKKQSDAIPLNKYIFQNERIIDFTVKINFVLENINKTKSIRSNPQNAINENNINNQNDENDENENNTNIGFGGNGAAYIAVDRKTKCQHQFLLCYQ